VSHIDLNLSLSGFDFFGLIGDMYRGVSDEEEPDWVKNEREQFENYRDKNKDGHMDAEEVKF